MGKSPLPDWLDIGIASYVERSQYAPSPTCKQNMDQTFPLEDVLSMARPFAAYGLRSERRRTRRYRAVWAVWAATAAGGNSRGFGRAQGGCPGRLWRNGMGGFPAGGSRGRFSRGRRWHAAASAARAARAAGSQRTNVRRMNRTESLFDGQARTLFSHTSSKGLGIGQKTRVANRTGTRKARKARDYLSQARRAWARFRRR